MLKDMVFERWLAEGCEERSDTLKMVGLVSFFLPFFPLERGHVRALFQRRLEERAAALAAQRLGSLAWGPEVIDFLTARVDFDGGDGGGDFPVEGAKEVGTLLTRYASRPLRQWAAAQHEALEQKQRQQAAQQQQRQEDGGGGGGGGGEGGGSGEQGKKRKGKKQQRAAVAALALGSGRLRVADSGMELTVEPLQALADS